MLKLSKLPFTLISILFIIDITTKAIFTNKQYLTNTISPIFIQYTQNYGSAFSMFSSVPYYQTIIAIFSIIILIGLIKYKNLFTKTKLESYSYLLIMAGILGNFYDRIFFGYVRDFIAIKNLFIFNIADIYLTLGVGLILYQEFKPKKKQKSNSNSSKKTKK